MAKKEILALYEDDPSTGLGRAKAAQAADTYLLPREVYTTDGKFTSEVADGATARGFTFESVTIANTAARVVAFKNGSSEVLSFDKDGHLKTGGVIGFGALTGLNGHATTFTYAPFGNAGIFSESNTAGLVFNSGRTNAAGYAVRFNSSTTLSAAGTLIASFANNSAQKALIDKDGNIESLKGLGLHGKTAPAQHSSTGSVSVSAAGSGTDLFMDTQCDGIGSGTGYTVGDIVTALKNIGILAT